MKKALCVVVISLWTSAAALAGQGVGRRLYAVPNGGFIESPSGDRVFTVADTSGSIATLQAAINGARSAHPDSVLVIRLAPGRTYSVTSAGLVLRSRECLVADGAVIRAATSAVRAPLITIAEGSTKVSVTGGRLDGNGASLIGIDAKGASRVNIDKVTVVGCRAGGVRLKGEGNTTFNNEMTVTRSDLSGSSDGPGISIESSTQTLVVDNNCHDNASGIRLAGAWARVVNNTCSDNGTGIDVASGNDNIVANNTCNSNATGIRAAATRGMIVSNLMGGNTMAGIASAGTSNNFIDNRFTPGNAVNFSSGGSGNNVIAYKAALSAPDQNYFFPPLIDNPHTNGTIVRGMGRTDVTVGSSSLDTVQSRYNAARSANPTKVVVLHLNGTFTVGAQPLKLSSNTCVLLNGTIQVSGATTAKAVIQVPSGQTRISLSGGTIDGGNRTGAFGIDVAGASLIQVDAVTIRNLGDNTEHHSGSDSIHFRNGGTPYVVTRCTINRSGARGIWLQTSNTKGLYADNTVTETRSGIDADSGTFGAVMLFNRLNNNTYGVFIEQGASHNTAIGNEAGGSDRYNIDVFNNDHSPETRYSTVACNSLTGGRTGMRTGSTPAGTRTSWNFIFNNVVRSAPVLSLVDGEENYYSQNVLEGSPLTTSGAETFFNSPSVP
jgi:parallel beta-helix repeat protein